MTVNDIRKQLVIFKSRNTENNGDQKGKILAYAYEQAIERIRNQKEGIRSLAMRALAWVTLAKRQITTSELQHALATQDGMTAISHDDLPDLTDITSACVGLLTIDEESHIVRLVHYTTHEYLEQTQNSWFPSAEESILRSCLTYLSFEIFKSGRCKSDEAFEHRIESFPLFHYAANHWECHLSPDTEAIEDVIHFLESQPSVEASVQARFAEKQHPLHQYYSEDFPFDMTGLHVAAGLGLTEATKLLLERDYDPNAVDSFNYTPLSWASFHGHEDVAELLIIAGANLEIKDMENERTPLMWATVWGHEAVVKLLLNKGSNINAQDDGGQTPLSFAAIYQHKSIIELLRQHGGTIDAEDHIGKIKIYQYDGLRPENRDMAQNSKESHYDPPEIGSYAGIYDLIECDADLNAKDYDGRTLLSYAAKLGQRKLVQLLIETGKVNLDEADDETGMTPLHWAAAGGYLSVVELITNAGAQLEMKDKIHQMTALGLAISNKQKDICEFLLQRDAIIHASTLYSAALWGEMGIIQQLVDRDIDINARTSHGLTALFPAVLLEDLGAAKLLIEKGADVNVSTRDGLRPLHIAIANNIDVTRLLIERGADVNAMHGVFTSTFSAAMYGKIDIVRLLIQMGADINTTMGGVTPLVMLILFMHTDAIQPLINLGADVNARDEWGRSPLFYAIEEGNAPAVELLVRVDDVDINSPDAEGNTPIMLAQELQSHNIIRILLQSGKVTNYGR